MIVKLYNTKSSNNTINKILGEPTEYDIIFKSFANILNPTIKITSNTLLIDINYCYIPEFKRYYFISDVTIESKSIYVLSLRCDVLESYKDDILLSNGLITRRADGNRYFLGDSFESEVKKEKDIYYSNVELDFIKNKLLVAIG